MHPRFSCLIRPAKCFRKNPKTQIWLGTKQALIFYVFFFLSRVFRFSSNRDAAKRALGNRGAINLKPPLPLPPVPAMLACVLLAATPLVHLVPAMLDGTVVVSTMLAAWSPSPYPNPLTMIIHCNASGLCRKIFLLCWWLSQLNWRLRSAEKF